MLSIVAAAELAARRPTAEDKEVLLRAVWQLVACVALVGLQVGICVVVHCTGISIVWNAMASFLLMQRRRARLAYQKQLPKKPEISEPHHLVRCVEWMIELRPVDHVVHLGVLVAVAVDLYYLHNEDTITTVAHGCALVLGCLLERYYAGTFEKPQDEVPEPEPRPRPKRRHNPREYVQVDNEPSLTLEPAGDAQA